MKKKSKKNGSFLQSIRARVLLMGTVAILVSAVLGVVGILSLRANNRNQEILAQINQINLYQYENDSLETDYLHYLKEQYLDHINANLSAMGASVSHAKKTAGNAYRDEFSSVEEAIASSRENYAALSEISASRGYSAGKGEYQHFLAPDEALAEGFLSLPAGDGQYDFSNALATMDNDFASYSKRVVEGTATASESESIRSMLTEMAQKLDASVASATQKEELLGLIGQKQEAFASMAAMDQEVLVLKQENNTLQDQLTEVTGSVRSQIETETQQNQRNLILLITVILAAGTVMLILMTLYIGKSISVSMKVFKQTLSQMTDGNLGVRAKVRGKDEFSQFSISINAFLDRLAEVIKNAQEISLAVRQSGEHLDDMAANSSMTSEEIKRAVKEISSGAATQAGESDSAAGQIEEMGKSFGLIVENVEHLGSIAAEMHRVSSEAAQFMQDLGDANEKTVHAFSQVASQTHSTNESVQKIREAAELITSIASQTNLLSLNASIEAARAGEAGKGFAVVATEIQHLSEQSNASADIIKQIIKEVSAQAELTVNVVDEVSEIVANQQHKLDMTKEHFAALEQKIQTSGSETEQIRRETDVCNTARLNVETVIMSLSAISEQNAASTEETTVSMNRLNGTIQQLVDASGELKEMAGQLENDLKFFHTGEN